MGRLTQLARNLETKRYITMMCGVLLCLFVTLGYNGIKMFSQADHDFHDLKDNNLQGATDLSRTMLAVWKLRLATFHSIDSDVYQSRLEGDQQIDAIEKSMSEYERLVDTDFEVEATKKWNLRYPLFLAERKFYYELRAGNKLAEPRAYLLEHISPIFDQVVNSLQELVEFQHRDALNKGLVVDQNIKKDRFVFLTLALGILLATLTTYFAVAGLGRAAQQIKSSEERLKLCLKAGRLGVWELDHHRQQLIFSETMNEAFGLPLHLQTVPLTKVLSLVHPDDRVAVEAHFEKTEERQENGVLEYRILRADGTQRWIHSRADLFAGLSHEAIRVMGAATDITVRKDQEFITQENLRAREEAMEKMSTLGEIAGGVAHEINNPLSVIQFVGERLQEGLANKVSIEAMNKLLEKQQKSVIRISKIISGLRVFSRNGNHDPFLPVKVKSLVEETLAFCMDKVKKSEVELTMSAISGELEIEGRQTELSQVIVNLVSNAIDALDGHKNKWINILTEDRGDSVEIAITDSGKGIPASVREKMFKKSFTTKPIGRGTGLGLGICKRIIESHHGDIYVDDQSQNTKIVVRLNKRRPGELAA